MDQGVGVNQLDCCGDGYRIAQVGCISSDRPIGGETHSRSDAFTARKQGIANGVSKGLWPTGAKVILEIAVHPLLYLREPLGKRFERRSHAINREKKATDREPVLSWLLQGVET